MQSKLAIIDRDLISSHQKEKRYEESLAVTKIKYDANYFFIYIFLAINAKKGV